MSLIASLALIMALAAGQPTQEPGELPDFGGKYAELTPRQKALIDDLVRRYNEFTGDALEPSEDYDGSRLSERTTYEAVTHALARSTLTDQNGDPLGSPLDLIDHLEAIEGKVEGGRSDQQFRLYVRLVPDAVETLTRSREFFRDDDNVRYHRGYPLSFRQNEQRVPSIQFSITFDGARADIDVDYRSAKFPAALVNGHLTAANSDIRAGNNIITHQSRWEGFVDWWRGLFGLGGLVDMEDAYELERQPDYEVPDTPRRGNERIDVAVHDFLQAWFVEKNSLVAASYVSRRADECIALEEGGDLEAFDYGLTRYVLIRSMEEDSLELGRVERLEDILTGVRLDRPGIRVVGHEHHAQFVLYGVTNEAAARFDCASRMKVGSLPEPRRVRRDAPLEDFDYFASTFHVELPKRGGYTLGLLWFEEKGFWRIVSYVVEPHGRADGETTLDIRPTHELAEVPRVAGDPEFIQAVDAFVEAWLVEKNIDEAMNYIAPSFLPCINLDLDAGETPLDSPAEQKERIRRGLEQTAEHLGAVSRLEQVIAGVDLWDPELREIIHEREDAYSLFSFSDRKGEAARCERRIDRKGTAETSETETPPSYGRFFGSSFSIQTVAGETVALLLGWTRQGDDWSIYTYRVVSP